MNILARLISPAFHGRRTSSNGGGRTEETVTSPQAIIQKCSPNCLPRADMQYFGMSQVFVARRAWPIGTDLAKHHRNRKQLLIIFQHFATSRDKNSNSCTKPSLARRIDRCKARERCLVQRRWPSRVQLGCELTLPICIPFCSTTLLCGTTVRGGICAMPPKCISKNHSSKSV
jgi:hypothetical protein